MSAEGDAEEAPPIRHLVAHAAASPDRPAVTTEPGGRAMTYAQLDARSKQVANLLWSRGLRQGDHVAVLLENVPEFFELVWGAMRMGLYITPINWHLAPDEAAYIVEDCDAAVIVASAQLGPVLDRLVAAGSGATAPHRFVVGGAVEGFEDYAAAVDAQSTDPVERECEGNWMLYSSGTTGRPKGIKPPGVGSPLGTQNPFTALLTGLYGFDERSTYLSPAPLYHAAPAGWTNAVQRIGGSVVVMDRFDPELTLAMIERHRVTHVQFVPTHLVRLLRLPEDERSRYDLSSLRYVIHAAAPCPPEVKRAAIEWLGPIVYEYYSGSEGGGFCAIGPDEWLAHPGSVGRSLLGAAHVADAAGAELGAGEVGQLWFESPSRFEYHGDPAKTAEAINERGWTSLGDMGYVDDEGYVYLTDRVSHMIISGGVNIYPREIEDVLILHPAVDDVAVVGVADPEMGERVRAVVQPVAPVADPTALEQELIEYCRAHLSAFKCPRSVVFIDELPRLPTGKLAKRLLPAEALTP
jgi:acyl-CoA synthetase (AMP-forming)/AMP-acid ligase II